MNKTRKQKKQIKTCLNEQTNQQTRDHLGKCIVQGCHICTYIILYTKDELTAELN